MPMTLKSRLAKMTRIAAKIAIGLTAFVLLIVLTCFVLNSFDAPLSDQAKALLAAPPNPYPPDGNIYLAMAGFEGPGDRSIIDMGQERIEAYNRALDSMLLDPEQALALNKKWDIAKLAFTGALPAGRSRTTSIWNDVKSHRQDIAALVASNRELYRRYLSLHRMQGYYETARASFLAPAIHAPQEPRTLFLADAASRIQTGAFERQEALNDIQHDLELWRKVLRGDGTLISKMVAVASLHADLILLADLITDPGIDLGSLGQVLDPILSPFGPNDYRIGNAFAAEFSGTAALYKTITAANELGGSMASSSWLKRPWNAFQAHFFKVNATENLGAAHAAQWVALGDSEPNQFYLNQERYRKWLKDTEPHLSPASLYNPIGKMLVAVAGSQKDSYVLRVYDVAAYQRLVYLAFQLRRQHIANTDVATFLKTHPEWSTHPVDGNTFRWNAESGELAVNTLGEHPKEQRFSMMLR
jgi:hypothetical protein